MKSPIRYIRVKIIDVESVKRKQERAGFVVRELSPEEAGCPSDLQIDETVLAIYPE